MTVPESWERVALLRRDVAVLLDSEEEGPVLFHRRHLPQSEFCPATVLLASEEARSFSGLLPGSRVVVKRGAGALAGAMLPDVPDEWGERLLLFDARNIHLQIEEEKTA